MSPITWSERLVNRVLRNRDLAQRVVQEHGLDAGARIAARFLKEVMPTKAGDFAPWQIEVLRALLQTLTAAGEEGLPTLDEVGAVEATLRFIEAMPEESTAALSAILAILEAGPAVLGPQRERRRFTRLDPSAQKVYLESWATSPLAPRRAIFRAVKSACMMGYWTRPQTWSVIGYDLESNPGVPDGVKTRDFEGEGKR